MWKTYWESLLCVPYFLIFNQHNERLGDIYLFALTFRNMLFLFPSKFNFENSFKHAKSNLGSNKQIFQKYIIIFRASLDSQKCLALDNKIYG